MDRIKIKIINKSGNELPAYETPSSAGMDVRAFLKEPVTLLPLERALIPTGLYIQLPHGYECQIRPRSGLALKHGISLVNTPGTVDADYRGEVIIGLHNHSKEIFTVHPNDRIAQVVIAPVLDAVFEETQELSDTVRGTGGFGSTGISDGEVRG